MRRVLWGIGLAVAAGLNPAYAADGLAARWVGQLRSDAGVCWVPHCGDGRTALEIARLSRLLVLAEDSSWDNVALVRAAARSAGLPGDRLLVDRADTGRAPFADNSVDLIVLDGLDDNAMAEIPAGELHRVLAPHGQLIAGSRNAAKLSRAALAAWLKAGGVSDASFSETDGLWVNSGKSMPSGVDDWSHWYHGPDNNPVSTDTVLKWPYGTQWLALPYQAPQPDITLVADGRVFLFIGHGWGGPGLGGAQRKQLLANYLLVRNAYNGQELWRRELPENFLVHRSCAVATPDTFYLLNGNGVLALDPATGRERDRIVIPNEPGEAKWLALCGSTLLMFSGDADPSFLTLKDSNRYGTMGDYKEELRWGFGRQFTAWDLAGKRVLWQHSEEKPVDSRLIGVREGRLFAYAPTSRAICLGVATGKELWSNATAEFLGLMDDREVAEGIINRTVSGALCLKDAVVFHRVGWKNIVALAPADGKVLWSKAPGKNAKKWGVVHLMSADDLLCTSVGNFIPATGKPGASFRLGTVCSRITGSPDAFYGQGGRCYDRKTGQGVSGQGLKTSCYDACIPADGMLFGAPQSCVCSVSLRGQIALAPASGAPPAIDAADAGRLERFPQADKVAPLKAEANDWPVYRADLQRSGGSRVAVGGSAEVRWSLADKSVATCPVSAGGLVFVGRADGRVQALDTDTGAVRWEYATAGRIVASPAVWDNRLYVGSGDGRVYCLEAATGRPLWCFLAAAQRRRIMVYGALAETWPVDSGVLVTPQPDQPGRILACFAAGINCLDGFHVWAVDARTGQAVWHQGGWKTGEESSGKDTAAQRTGVCAGGGLTVQGGRLWMAGGGWVGRTAFDLSDGRMLPADYTGAFDRGPAAEIGVFAGRYIYLGGSVLYRNPGERRWASKTQNLGLLALDMQGLPQYPEIRISDSCITPAWDSDLMALTGGEGSASLVIGADVKKLASKLDATAKKPLAQKFWDRPMAFRMPLDTPPLTQAGPTGSSVAAEQPKRWEQKRETYGLALAANAVLVLSEAPAKVHFPTYAERSWSLAALDRANGQLLWELKLPGEPALNGLCLEPHAHVIVTMADGTIVCVDPVK